MQTLKNKLSKFSLRILLSTSVFLVILNFVAISPVWAATSACNKKTPTSTSLNNCLKENPIIKQLNNIVNFLSAGVGIVVVGSIMIGGIQYSLAGNNPQAVSAAKKRIQDTLIALIAFFFVYALLQWLIPGQGGLIDSIIK